MRCPRSSSPLALALATLLACGGGLEVDRDAVGAPAPASAPAGPADPAPPAPPAPPATPAPPADDPGAGGDPGIGSVDPPPAGDGRSVLQVELERAGSLPQVSRVVLEVSGVALYLGARPAPPAHGLPCDVAGAQWYDLTARVAIDADERGTSPLARLETASPGDVAEIRVFARGSVQRRNRQHNLDGRETCVAGDGFDVAVLRIRPAAPMTLTGGRDYRVVVPFDFRETMSEERIDCGPTRQRNRFHDTDGPDECRTPDDAGDDGDPRTRLRYVLAGEATGVADEQGP